MKAIPKSTLVVGLISLFALSLVPTVYSATTFSAIVGYDPNTYWSTAPTAGIDFNDGSPTQAGFLGIAASNNTAYNVTHNGITFDIVVSNTNTGNQNRDRGTSGGDLVRDFEQWYNNSGTGVLVEASVNFSGLVANTNYEISFFTFNIGAGQSTHSFYDGASSADPLITTFTTAGNQLNYSTWSPGITFFANSGSTGEIDITAQSSSGSRLTLNGISLVQGVTIPEPSAALLGGLGVLMLLRRRR